MSNKPNTIKVAYVTRVIVKAIAPNKPSVTPSCYRVKCTNGIK